MNKLLNWMYRKLSRNGHRIALFAVSLDIDKYHKAVKGSATCHLHPDIADDEELKQMAFNMIDYIRNHYDMDKLITVEKNPRK